PRGPCRGRQRRHAPSRAAMIFGVFARDRDGQSLSDDPERAAARYRLPAPAIDTPQLTLWFVSSPGNVTVSPLRDVPPSSMVTRADGALHVALEGRVFNASQLARDLVPRGPADAAADPAAAVLAHGYAHDSERFLDELNGTFAFALWDGRARRLVLG